MSVCCICQDTNEECVDISVLPCGHRYHSKCLVTCLSIKRECPLCRAKTGPESDVDSDSDSDSVLNEQYEYDLIRTRRQEIQMQRQQLANLMRRKSTQVHPVLKKKAAKLRSLQQVRASLTKTEILPLHARIAEYDKDKRKLLRLQNIDHKRHIRQLHDTFRRATQTERSQLRKLCTKRNRLDRSIDRLSNEMLSFIA